MKRLYNRTVMSFELIKRKDSCHIYNYKVKPVNSLIQDIHKRLVKLRESAKLYAYLPQVRRLPPKSSSQTASKVLASRGRKDCQPREYFATNVSCSPRKSLMRPQTCKMCAPVGFVCYFKPYMAQHLNRVISNIEKFALKQ